MSLILEQIIQDVLKEHVDSNLKSEHARKTIADEITDMYFTSSNDTKYWTCSALNEQEGEENVKSN